MKVRQATLLDLLLITPLAELYVKEAKQHDQYTFDLQTSLHNASSTIMSEDGCFLVAIDKGLVVGFLWGHAANLPWSRKILAFDTILYVRPDKRKYSSAGYKLMKHWEQWAKERGAEEVQISIASGIHEEDTLKFYKKLGYHYIGTQLRKEC